jgi:predicted metal-binding membrane protein
MHQDLRLSVSAGGMVALSAAAWLLLAWMALDMGHPLVQLTMPGNSDWSAMNAATMLVMWAVMMAAMMLPSALPTVLTFVRLNVQRGEGGRAGAFVAAYLLVWTAFSASATAFQWLLQDLDWVDPMIVSTSVPLTACLLVIAGIYQFSPLKRMCLAQCRAPMAFLVAEWRPGAGGAFAMGLRHGLLCAGCCWALMVLLFVGGVMNIAWVAALSVAVAIEKLAPRGEQVARVLGALLIAAGVFKLGMMLAGT